MNQTIKKFEEGNQYVNVISAVTKKELAFIENNVTDFKNQKMVKFIPASGAATRMFKNLFTFLETQENTEFIDEFFENLEDFAFYDELSAYLIFKNLDKNHIEDRMKIIETLLNTEMDYGSLPKALLTFHQYCEGFTTPIDEHICEGEQYLDADEVKLHFTISPEHEEQFTAYVQQALAGKDYIQITYSFQKEETNTMAVDMDNEPFVLENGGVFYRPGGHGALIENLNDLDEDVIFIKNIDNVCHRSRIEKTIESKKMLASIGMGVKQQIDRFILDLVEDDFDLDEIETFIADVLNSVC